MTVGILLGFVAGTAVVFVWHVVRQSTSRSRLGMAEGRLSDSQRALAELTTRADALAATAAAAETARAVAEAELDLVRQATTNSDARVAEERQRLAGTFAELSAEALQKNNEQFLALADTRLQQAQTAVQGDLTQRHQAMAQLLGPLSETLVRYEQELKKIEAERQGAYASLNEKVAQLNAGNALLQKETRSLVTALRSPQTRGRWGEIQLRRVVEMAGMLEHCDFEEQVSSTVDGGRLRPDLVVHMPGDREMVVDAKVPLDAYLQLVDADDEQTRNGPPTRTRAAAPLSCRSTVQEGVLAPVRAFTRAGRGLHSR